MEKRSKTDTKMTGYTWRQFERKEDWKIVINGLYPKRDKGHR